MTVSPWSWTNPPRRPRQPPAFGPVEISTRDVYDAVMRLDGSVGRLIDQGAGHGEDLADHEKRLRALEANRWPLPAAALLLSAVAVLAAILPMITT